MVCTNSRTYLLQKKYNSHQWGGSNMWLHNWDEKRQNAILARNFDGRSVIFDLLLNACCRLLLKLLNRTKLWILLSFWVLWWARTHMFHHATSPLNSQMQKQKQMCLLQMLFLHHSTSIVFQGSGLQESVLVSMICRAVCYFLPCDLDLSEAKKWMKGYVGIFCPCYLFGRNAEALGSGTMMGSCMMHFILWALVNTVCCVLTEGVMLGLPGCFVACYACGYRRTLRANYNLEEAPCGDFVTHFFCHLCAMCQEYREIRERSQDLNSTSRNMVEVAAPPVQKMEPASPK